MRFQSIAIVSAFSASLIGAQSTTDAPTTTKSAGDEVCTSCSILDNVDGGHTIAVFANATGNVHVTATVIPHVTHFKNGSEVTSFETSTPSQVVTATDGAAYVVVDGKYTVDGQVL